MAAPMRPTSSQDPGHRPRVADSNFEYDDNEWDIGIGDLIIDLDADIEKTDEGGMASNASPSAKAAAAAKMAVEHSATVDKGLKMKIKRTKPGTKSSEAKHEIVKSNELNGGTETAASADANSCGKSSKHPSAAGGCGGVSATTTPTSNMTGNSTSSSSSTSSNATNAANPNGPASGNSGGGGGSSSSKRGSSGHRRDKKHSSEKPNPKVPVNNNSGSGAAAQEVNGVLRVTAPVTQRPVFPASTGPGPPQVSAAGQTQGPPASPAAATGSAAKPEQAKVSANSAQSGQALSVAAAVGAAATVATQATPPSSLIIPTQQQQQQQQQSANLDDGSSSPPPSKKLKTEPKDMNDVCVGTSVGTITEPDCLGPCEPGTSVTLEGIVWHETEGGVLVVNVTWRGKTYVGTLLDCTRHDWAPPRFCDSPTSDLDTRTPKGRGKRGRSAAAGATPSTDLSNFTETRSSVHSKLRNGGTVKGRRGAANGSAPTTAPSSPTPFIPPRPEPTNKRKSRAGEEEPTNNVIGKKSKVGPVPPNVIPATPPASTCSSPPPSPVLLECPEPNCSKKYKHINGLKYHQSHAHNAGDDEDTKDVTSMSENDESNIEAPSPATPVKSPEKCQDSPLTPQKKDTVELPSILRGLDVPSQPNTPLSTPPSPATPQSDLAPVGSPTVVPVIETKSVVKPGVLRYTTNEEFPVGVFSGKAQTNATGINKSEEVPPPVNNATLFKPQDQIATSQSSFANQLQVQQPTFSQPPSLLIPTQNNAPNNSIPSPSQSPKPSPVGQFKVKPTAALMPEDKNKTPIKPAMPASFKKKNRKSPAGSPDPPTHNETPVFGIEQQSGRDEVQSPAYSDISDDGAPVLETEDKSKSDKKTDNAQPMQHMQQYGMYLYGQPSYMVPSVQPPQQQQPQDATKPKEVEKIGEKPPEKEIKKENPEYQPKVLPQHYYPPYGYMPPQGYAYNMDPPSFAPVPVLPEEKIKEERVKENQSPIDQTVKPNPPIPNPIQVPTPGKVKNDQSNKSNAHQHQTNHLRPQNNQFIDADHQKNENHQILKESIEMKNQMSSYGYSRQNQQHHNQQREQDMRRYYVFDQHRKEPPQEKNSSQSTPNKPPPQSSSLKHSSKDNNKSEDKKEKEVKQEGVKPTMETQGPPPPPTSQQYYIHPSYMQSPHYGALHFDPNHPMYRGIMVPGPYSGSPYFNPQMPRYHGPEDLSRAQPPTKALDMLQHHAQYYSSHKIHELQERAIKSPTPKTSVASSSPSSVPLSSAPSNQIVPQPLTTQAGMQSNQQNAPNSGKQTPGDPNKDSRSPPPQRHVHTHHHTHVGLGYPTISAMYPAPYGAAVLASQQAAVTMINSYPPK